ncbi:hypothetical protein Godav_029537 [Gossypium davidsonii]|uniref:Uncharacterized protein n=1 Tax=Gossypium davidsonii TaxID=34287 RepID=A0A7J8TCI1_GOSDV|nr:hypothetical protein [Gossypium davidsonii]
MESLKFNALSKKLQTQCSYIGDIKENQKAHLYSEKRSDTMQGVQEDSWLTTIGAGIEIQKEGGINEEKKENRQIY